MERLGAAELIRVLWIDPDDHIYNQCVPVLTRPGWSITRAHTFLDALEFSIKSAFDFAIIELNLPDAVGTDVWRHIKMLYPDILGIITTGSPSLRSLINVAEPGILGYLLKPLEVNAVGDMIDGAVQNITQSHGSVALSQ